MSWSLVIDLAGPALAALIGAWIGTRLALRRFKKERAYEYRIDWYRKTLRAANESWQGFTGAAALFRNNMHRRADQEMKKATDASDRLRKLAHEAELFATPSTVESLRKVEAEHVAATAEDLESAMSTSSRQELVDDLEELAGFYGRQRAILEREGRKVLQLEELEG